MKNWIKNLAAWLVKTFALKPTTGEPVPAPADVYTVRVGDRVERTLKVPCRLKFQMTGKRPGTPEREEVLTFAYSAGGDFRGGNPTLGTFSARAHDSRPDWGKLKCYGVSGYSGEPPLRMPWHPAEKYTVELEILANEVTWTAVRLSDDYMAQARCATDVPPLVTIGYGDPPGSSRKAAEGVQISSVRWDGQP